MYCTVSFVLLQSTYIRTFPFPLQTHYRLGFCPYLSLSFEAFMQGLNNVGVDFMQVSSMGKRQNRQKRSQKVDKCLSKQIGTWRNLFHRSFFSVREREGETYFLSFSSFVHTATLPTVQYV